MRVVFLDQIGCYASVLAASYAMGLLKESSDIKEIIQLPGFAAHETLELGKSYFGCQKNQEVCITLGVGKEGKIIKTSADDLVKILGNSCEIKVVDVSQFNTGFIHFLWYLKLLRPFERISIFWAAWILKKRLPEMVNLVKKEVSFN